MLRSDVFESSRPHGTSSKNDLTRPRVEGLMGQKEGTESQSGSNEEVVERLTLRNSMIFDIASVVSRSMLITILM